MPIYPHITYDLNKIQKNAKYITQLCNTHNVQVAGTPKGVNGNLKIAQAMLSGGIAQLASSRISHLKKYKEMLDVTTFHLRIPMIDELDTLAKYVDISLHSEIDTLKRLSKKCKALNKTHKVVLMVDVGDLREGFFNKEELLNVASWIENEDALVLYGIGTNIGCYGSIRPTVKNMNQLINLAEAIEKKINRTLDIISGGATSSITLLYDEILPERINHLRIGEAILLARDLTDFWGYNQSKELSQKTMKITAQIIEIKNKPSFPIGEVFIDAFGNMPTYQDIGIRKRALLAIGKQDIGHHDKLIPEIPGIQLIGSSSDHLIIDITDVDRTFDIGDTVSFYPYYQAMLYASISEYVKKRYLE